MLNPQANHSMKAEFLKHLLVQTLRTRAGQQSELRPVNILVMNLSEAIIDTEEWLDPRWCDILIRDEKEGFLCIIENKITSMESPKQTQDYYQNSFKRFPSDQYPHRLYIYLTPEGDPPQSEQFIPLSYGDILTCVTEILKIEALSTTEKVLLTQFQENILRGIAMDKNSRDLAQVIYDQHYEAIEFIIKTVERKEDTDEIPIQRSWDGKTWFFNIGENSGYRWEDCQEYGFICAGGATRYRDLMERFEIDQVIYAYVSKSGYVGIGKVSQEATPFRNAILKDGRQLQNLPLTGNYDNSTDDDTCDWIAFIEWKFAVEKGQAVRQPTITRMTTSRIYEHRKDIARKVRSSLESYN
jgi:hypothetical protein